MPLTYEAIKNVLVPGLRYSQDIFEEIITHHVNAGTTWLDAGCGWHLLPPWRPEAEHALVQRARAVVDGDEGAVRKHRTIHMLAVADLEHLPLHAQSVNLVTCNVVVEHLRRPRAVFAEFARVLQPGGRAIIHTPNVYSHFVPAARRLPRRLKAQLVAALELALIRLTLHRRFKALRTGIIASFVKAHA